MRRLISALLLAPSLVLAAPALAQEAPPDGVPDRRVAISRDVDFYGSDLATLFDTTLDACQAACLGDPACVAFTYNTQAAACFPKSGLGEVRPFAGGISGRVLATDPAVLARAPALAARLTFLEPTDLRAAEELGRALGREHSSDEHAPGDLLDWATLAEGEGDPARALALTGAALALTDDPALWREYARLALAQPEGDGGAAGRARALPAAVAAALRGEGDAGVARGLLLVAQALEAEGRGRASIGALRLALALAPTPEAEAALDRAQGLYGFAVAETQVDSDAAEPRACVLFNEPLRAGLDYAPYVQLADPGLVVTARDAQLCVEGAAHGAHLSLVLREGLPAASGEALARAVPLDLYIRDRQPAARVLSRAYVLPRGGDAQLPIETVNLDEVDLEVLRVSDANLLRSLAEGHFGAPVEGWDRDWLATTLATPVWEGTLRVAAAPANRDVVTAVPLGEALGGEPPGVYALIAAVPGADPDARPATSQWFVLTDLGLATFAGGDGLLVAVRSLADAGAVEGATVTLLSRANAVLGTARTDAQGVARFDAGLARGEGAQAPALVTVVTGDPDAPTDMAFLSLLDPAFDLSDRGVEGREAPGPVDAFLHTDRGAYRPGETVHATALLRDERARAVAGVPLTAILLRPDGVEHARATSAGVEGGHAFALPVAPNAPRGTWTLRVAIDPDEPLAQASLLVEDFLPERIDVALEPGGEGRPGEALPVDLSAEWLFGAPGAGLAIEGEATLAPAAEVPGFAGYVWGRHDEPLDPAAESFAGDMTSADGTARLLVPLPGAEGAAPQPLEARLAVRVLDSAGRPVERRLTVPVRAADAMIGLRPPAEVVPEGGRARIGLVGLGPDLAPAPMDVRWTVDRVETRYQWYEVGGAWSWEPVTARTRVAEGALRLEGAPATVEVPVEWGEYEIAVERTDGPYAAASARFAAGWYAAATAEEAPDRLAVALDAPAYAPGDTATLTIDAEGPGTALVTVLTNRVVAMEAVELGAGPTRVALSVTDDWGAGAYVAATLLRPLEGRAPGQGREPARSLGLAHAAVEPGDRRLPVTLDAPGRADPRGPLSVGVEVGGVAAGEAAFVTLAAVDVGILNLTGHETPDPTGHYFGQRRLGVELRDLYGRLIQEDGAPGELREGGDAAAMTLRSAPPTEALLAFFEGPVPVDAEGRAEVTFDLPAFNGTVRLMAVAWSAAGVGSAESEVVVRDPVVLTASLPRALSPGDQSRLRLELTHAEGPAGAFGVEVAAPGLDVAVPAGGLVAELAPGGTWRRDLALAAPAAGVHEVRVTVTTPDGRRLDRALALPVAARDPAVARSLRFALNPGEAFTFDDAVLAGFAPGTAEATLSVGPLARLDAPGLLRQLDAVPWGCTEQVASGMLPLLYLAEVATAAGLGAPSDLDRRIGDAVALILANQASNGSFGLWGPYGGDLWLDAYVTDVLARARAAGHAVPDEAFGLALGNLRNEVAAAPDFEPESGNGGEGLAYALLVLAREGEALVGDLRYFADARADAFGTPLALAQLGAALAQYGDQPRADALFARAEGRLEAWAEDPLRSEWRADYGTRRRDAAAVLALAVEAGSQAVDRDRLLAGLAAEAEPASTQEAAWTLLAAAALAGDLRAAGVTVDGAAPSGPAVVRTGDGAPARRIANAGAAPVDLTVTAIGVPEGEVVAEGRGWAIERAYYTLEGDPAAPEAVAAGTRLVAVLTVTPLGFQAGRLMVTDPLPGGWEVENPSLLASGAVEALPWLDPVAPAHVEARDDRVLAAVDWQGEEPFRVAHVVRAVTPGTYRHPAASVEDMYRPALRARTAAGSVAVTE